MTAWDDYLAAAQRLDAVRWEAASMVAEQAAAAEAARADMTGVRQRVALQHSRLVAAAKDTGVPIPESATATAELPRDPTAVRAALGEAGEALTAADALLSTVEHADRTRLGRISNWPVVPRNLLVYVSYALFAVLVPLITLGITTNRFLLLPTIGCATVLPLLGYGLAWLTVGMLYRPEHAGKVRRTPLIGLAATVATVVVLYALYGVLTVAHVL